MGEFFRGWKRKIGVVTLILACAFGFVWVRSIFLVDQFFWQYLPTTHDDGRQEGIGEAYAASAQGGAVIFLFSPIKLETMNPLWAVGDYSEKDPGSMEHWDGRWNCSIFSFKFQRTSYPKGGGGWLTVTCPYWAIVLPLTLLSGYLLLSKPRIAKRKVVGKNRTSDETCMPVRRGFI
jgi:hypothetical protein